MNSFWTYVSFLALLLSVLECSFGQDGVITPSPGEKAFKSAAKYRIISSMDGDDEDDAFVYSGGAESGSGSGSGEEIEAITDRIPLDVSTQSPSTATTGENASSGDIQTSTHAETTTETVTDHEVINPSTTEKPTTTDIDNNVEGSTDSNGSDDDDDNFMLTNHVNSRISQAVHKKHNDKKKGLTFTVGIIAGVVIGALLAIVIILFLVYRLRKKDAGSYLLEDSSTAYKPVPGSPGGGDKEYYT